MLPETSAQRCLASHLGLYLMHPQRFEAAVRRAVAGTTVAMVPPEQPGRRKAYQVHDGIAVIPISGTMFKGFSKFAETDTVQVRRAVRAAASDEEVKGIMLHIDSPGGLVAGTADLADDVLESRSKKPVHAFVSDLAASAAYWVASQAGRIVANQESSFVGSIGVLAVVDDFSGKFEKDGIRTHVISTGGHKGAFVQGSEVTEEQLAELQREVDAIGDHFFAQIARGRKGLGIAKVRDLADGRLHTARDATKLGLIDGVESFERAMAALSREARSNTARRRRAEHESEKHA